MPILNLEEPGFYRAIAADQDNIIAEVTISEDHDDELVVTEHPVEFGAVMSDHAYKRPPEVRLRVGWSATYGGYSTYVQDIYRELLDLQLRRKLFEVYTGKRYYKNILIAGIHVLTDQQTEYAFLADILLRQVFLAQTQTTQVTGLSKQSSNQANPTKTTVTEDSGRLQVQPTNVEIEQGIGNSQPVSTTVPDNNLEQGVITNTNDGGSTVLAPTN